MTNDLTPEEWGRVRKYIAEGPETTYLETTEEGTCVIFAGGVIHPIAYLEIMEMDDEEFAEKPVVDILKNFPGSLGSGPIRKWKP